MNIFIKQNSEDYKKYMNVYQKTKYILVLKE